ncbi:hypothetical protein ACGFWI_01235 [Streptomyces sp. NPDC048434]|uniref:hypothetical protein n=1 Tax=Streptomyces sp. NPDC048434 TaxID=3365549 RepID=UPI0037131F7C
MTTVLALYRHDDLTEHREALCPWLKANGIDPDTVAMDWISVEEDAGQRVIRYRTFKVTPDGRRLDDPDDARQGWRVERTTPLQTGLPAGPSRCVMTPGG